MSEPHKYEVVARLGAAPRWTADGQPVCTAECPSHDGKRCKLTGFRPALHCEPAIIEMAEEICRLRAKGGGAGTRRPCGMTPTECQRTGGCHGRPCDDTEGSAFQAVLTDTRAAAEAYRAEGRREGLLEAARDLRIAPGVTADPAYGQTLVRFAETFERMAGDMTRPIWEQRLQESEANVGERDTSAEREAEIRADSDRLPRDLATAGYGEVHEHVRDLLAMLDEARKATEEREGDMHARIRAEYDRTIADSWRAKLAEVTAERDAEREKAARSDAVRCDEIEAWRVSTVRAEGALAALREAAERVQDACDAQFGTVDEGDAVDVARRGLRVTLADTAPAAEAYRARVRETGRAEAIEDVLRVLNLRGDAVATTPADIAPVLAAVNENSRLVRARVRREVLREAADRLDSIMRKPGASGVGPLAVHMPGIAASYAGWLRAMAEEEKR